MYIKKTFFVFALLMTPFYMAGMEIETYCPSFLDLPGEVQWQIGMCLDFPTKVALSKTCKWHRDLFTKDKICKNLTAAQHRDALIHTAQTGNRGLIACIIKHETNENKNNRLAMLNFFKQESLANQGFIVTPTERAYKGLSAMNKMTKIIDLMIALHRENEDACIILLKNGVDADDININADNALIMKVQQQRRSMVDLLLQHECVNKDHVNIEGKTALHYAAMHKNRDIVRLLLEHGCNTNIQDSHGYTPLHVVLRKKATVAISKTDGTIEIARMLIDHGADTTLKTTKGNKTAFELGHKTIVRQITCKRAGDDITGEEPVSKKRKK